MRSIQLVEAPFNVGPEAQREYVMKEPVETMLSNLSRSSMEYLSSTFLVLIPETLYILNSAFLFSSAKNKANKPIDKINQGDIKRLDATPPEIDLNKKPAAIQKISKRGSFFNFKQ